jgi:hypothetical protein
MAPEHLENNDKQANGLQTDGTPFPNLSCIFLRLFYLRALVHRQLHVEMVYVGLINSCDR